MTVLLFVATIITFLAIDYFVRRGKAPVHAAATAPRHVSAFRMPEGIYFSKTHTWLTLFPSGSVQLGVDDFATRMFTNPRVTLLKKEGDPVEKGEAIIRLEEEGKSFALRSPLTGRVTRRNAHLAESNKALREDTFLHGWAYQMEPNEGASVLRDFFLGAETRTWMKSELARLRDFMAHAAGSTSEGTLGAVSYALQDGGEPMPGVMDHLSNEECIRFETQFLAND